jgi:small subunit ribosomal protein S17
MTHSEPATTATATKPQRNRRRAQIGMVVSDKMEKTIVVDVERFKKHPRYEKYLRRKKRYHVHDEKSEAKVGDQVEIVATRPISKQKRWRLVRIVRAGVAQVAGAETLPGVGTPAGEAAAKPAKGQEANQ